MLFTTACAAVALLAALPFAAAAPESNITYTQTTNITEPVRNTTGVLVNVMYGTLKTFEESLGGSSTIDWSDETGLVGGGWSFGAGNLGGGSGGWKFSNTSFEYGGGVTLDRNASVSNFLVTADQAGNVKLSFNTTRDMKCTTTPASQAQLAKTECIVTAPST